MSTSDTSKDDAPNLGEIAFQAEQQCADLQALLETLIEAYSDPTHNLPRTMKTILRLLTPIGDHLSTLSWELMPDSQPSQPPAEEAQR